MSACCRMWNDETLNFLMISRVWSSWHAIEYTLFLSMMNNERKHASEREREKAENNPNDISMIAIPLQFGATSNVPHSHSIRKPTNNFQLHLKSNIYSFNYGSCTAQFFPCADVAGAAIAHHNRSEEALWLHLAAKIPIFSIFLLLKNLSRFFFADAVVCAVIFIIDFSHLSTVKITIQLKFAHRRTSRLK